MEDKHSFLPENFSWTHEAIIKHIDKNLSPGLKKQLDDFNAINVSTLIYGGMLRDSLSNAQETDVDINLLVMEKNFLDFTKELDQDKSFKRKKQKLFITYEKTIDNVLIQFQVTLIKKEKGVYLEKTKEKIFYEFSKQTKIPINSLLYLYHPEETQKRFFDFFGGVEDIKNSRIDILDIYSETLETDTTLIHKIFKLLAKHNSTPSENVVKALNNAHKYIQTNKKRFKFTSELLMIFDYDYADKLIKLLKKYHFFEQTFLSAKIGVKKDFSVDFEIFTAVMRDNRELYKHKPKIVSRYFFVMVLWPLFSTLHYYYSNHFKKVTETEPDIIHKIAEITIEAQKKTLSIPRDSAEFFHAFSLWMKTNQRSEVYSIKLFMKCQDIISSLSTIKIDEAIINETCKNYIVKLLSPQTNNSLYEENSNDNTQTPVNYKIEAVSLEKKSKLEASDPSSSHGTIKPKVLRGRDYYRRGSPFSRLINILRSVNPSSQKVTTDTPPAAMENISSSALIYNALQDDTEESTNVAPPDTDQTNTTGNNEFTPGPSYEPIFVNTNTSSVESTPKLLLTKPLPVQPPASLETNPSLPRPRTSQNSGPPLRRPEESISQITMVKFFVFMFCVYKCLLPKQETMASEFLQNLGIASSLVGAMGIFKMTYDANMDPRKPYPTEYLVDAFKTSTDFLRSKLEKPKRNTVEIIEETPGVEILESPNIPKPIAKQTANLKSHKVERAATKVSKSSIQKSKQRTNRNSPHLHRSSPLRNNGTSNILIAPAQNNNKRSESDYTFLFFALGIVTFLCSYRASTAEAEQYAESLQMEVLTGLICFAILGFSKMYYDIYQEMSKQGNNNNTNENRGP